MTEAETIANAVNEMLRQMAVDRDRIEALEKAICDYAAAVVGMEGVTFEEYIKDDASQKIVVDILNARAALEGKDVATD